MNGDFIKKYSDNYIDYLHDESRLTGKAESISFPNNQNEIKEILKYLFPQNINITIQGGRTGITGGAVPFGGHVLNLSGMNKISSLRFDEIEKTFFISVQPGLTLLELNTFLDNLNVSTSSWKNSSIDALKLLRDKKSYFFPPDPTESSATIGGITACKASGARSYKYGSLNNYVEKISVVFSDGDSISLKRGENFAEGRNFSIILDSGKEISGILPEYSVSKVKNACGYYVAENMDIIDLFIGMEGTLGVVTEIELRLIEKPDYTWGVMIFFPDEKNTFGFIKQLRNLEKTNNKPAVMEYFNEDSLDFLKKMRDSYGFFEDIKNIPEEKSSAVYIEFHGNDENEISDIVFPLGSVIENYGGSDSNTWIGTEEREIKKMKFFRHAIPEAVNSYIDIMRGKGKDIRKLGTDMSVPLNKLSSVIDMYNVDLKKGNFNSIIFGHFGDNHLHVNILPLDKKEYDRGKKMFMNWASKVVSMGGSVSAEHGIGKEKKDLIRIMYGDKYLQQMHNLKSLFDNKNLLNNGNLFF